MRQALPRLAVAATLVAAGVLALPALARPTLLAAAGAPIDGVGLAPSDPHALQLLKSAASISASRSWQGSEVVSTSGAGATTVVAEVRHRALVGSVFTVVSGRSDVPSRSYTVDDSGRAAGVGDGQSSPLSSPVADVSYGRQWAALLARAYSVSDGGPDAVAGQPCERLDLRRADGSVAGRVWVGNPSGLILQRQVFDTGGGLLRYLTFTKIDFVPDSAVTMTPSAEPAAAAGLSDDRLAALRAQGWPVPPAVAPGMALVTGDADGTPAQLRAHSPAASVALSYSDGLSSLLISEEPGHLPSRPPTGWVREVRQGAAVQVQNGNPRRMAWDAGGLVISLVSDADGATVDAALATLPRQAAASSYSSRLRRGFDRVGSWLDPRR